MSRWLQWLSYVIQWVEGPCNEARSVVAWVDGLDRLGFILWLRGRSCGGSFFGCWVVSRMCDANIRVVVALGIAMVTFHFFAHIRGAKFS